MKAMVFDRYGSSEVLRLRDVEPPTVGDGEVLVRVRAAALNPYDWHFMTGMPLLLMRPRLGLRRPRITRLGADLAGVVEAVGRDVTRFSPGDEVFGRADRGETDSGGLGSVAEFISVPAAGLRHLPADLTHEEAAAIPLAASTALQALRKVAPVGPGQHVLITGAGGGVGHFAVQIAKAFGAEVTGVCSTSKVDLVRSLGADHVIDYTRDDPTRSERRYDLVFDNVGSEPVRAWRRVLAPDGTYLASFDQRRHRWLGPMAAIVRALVTNLFVSQRLAILPTERADDDLDVLVELIDSGQLRPVVGHTFPLAATAEAMDRLAAGHARGKVVITIEEA